MRARFKMTRYKCKFCITDNHATDLSDLLRVDHKSITAQPTNIHPEDPKKLYVGERVGVDCMLIASNILSKDYQSMEGKNATNSDHRAV